MVLHSSKMHVYKKVVKILMEPENMTAIKILKYKYENILFNNKYKINSYFKGYIFYVL